MDSIADRVPAGSNGVFYTPWIWGERAPVDNRSLRAGLYNVSLNTNRADIIRAFFEGVAYNTRWLLEPVSHFLGRKMTSLNCVGGGAASAVWCRIFADVLGVEVRQMADPIQANARGAAFIAAAGLGDLAFSDVPDHVPVQQSFDPDERTRSVYEQGYRAFRDIYRRMKSFYTALNGNADKEREER
jgi:xylulokinase